MDIEFTGNRHWYCYVSRGLLLVLLCVTWVATGIAMCHVGCYWYCYVSRGLLLVLLYVTWVATGIAMCHVGCYWYCYMLCHWVDYIWPYTSLYEHIHFFDINIYTVYTLIIHNGQNISSSMLLMQCRCSCMHHATFWGPSIITYHEAFWGPSIITYHEAFWGPSIITYRIYIV